MPPGQESLVIIVDYKSCTLRTNPSISVAHKVRMPPTGRLETIFNALFRYLPSFNNIMSKHLAEL